VANGARAVDVNPNNANARNAYAQALIAANRPEEAIVQLDEADRLAPRGFNYYISLANRGWAHVQAGRLEEAFATYDRALQVNPTNPGALQPKMCLLAKFGRMPEAVAVLRHVRTLYTDATRDLLVGSTRRGIPLGNKGPEFADLTAQVWDAMEKDGGEV
jgi:Tfp pilus assembly protein PilF